MKPVFQDKFGVPDGNCFASCVASILEVPRDDVPHVPVEGYAALQTYLAAHGFQYLEVPMEVLRGNGEAMCVWPMDTYAILCGPSPNIPDVDHAVVGRVRTKFIVDEITTDEHHTQQELQQHAEWQVVHDPNAKGKPFDPWKTTTVGFFIRTGDPT